MTTMISDLDDAIYWSTGVDELIERSPTTCTFATIVGSNGRAEKIGSEMEGWIGEALADLDEDDPWWEAASMSWARRRDVDGLVDDMFRSQVSYFGWGIDREQKIRTLGYFPHIEGYNRPSTPRALALRMAAVQRRLKPNTSTTRPSDRTGLDAIMRHRRGIRRRRDPAVRGRVVALPDAATMATCGTSNSTSAWSVRTRTSGRSRTAAPRTTSPTPSSATTRPPRRRRSPNERP